jgi:hypothetical protein
MEIRSGKKKSPRRILIYGTRGIGKSTFASMAERPIFIPTEDGLDDIDCRSYPVCRNYAAVIAAISDLYSDPQDFKTVAIDSADWLERLIHAEVCGKRQVETIEDIGFGKGYAFALPLWQEVLDGLDALRSKGMTAIFIAHAKIEKFNNPETDAYDRYEPKLHKSSSAILQEWCTEVLFANYKVFTTATDDGFGKKRHKPAAVADRILRTTERPAHVAKNRVNLPDELPLDYREFAKFVDPDPAAVTASQVEA